jgi:glycosyltransferase involved in cell wall biosynthesis
LGRGFAELRNEVLYVGDFKLPDRNAGAVRVLGVADALTVAGYTVTLIGDDYTGPAGTDRRLPLHQRLSVAANRGLERMLTSSGLFRQLNSVNWEGVAAVICYPGSAALILRLMHSCRRHGVPLIIDSVEWYDPSHTLFGRFGPFAIDSEFRMRWLQKRTGNVICISSLLAEYYAGKGCNVIRVPPLVGKESYECITNLAISAKQPTDQITMVYAGTPGRKELFTEIVAGVQALIRRGINVSFKVVGVTEDELFAIVQNCGGHNLNLEGFTCYGRLPRHAALQIVAASDFTVILRPQERYANAGFPSKLVESFSLGVPVIANATSDIAEYLRDGLDGYLLGDATAGALEDAILRASQLTSEHKQQMRINARLRARECFDYRKFVEPLAKFISATRPCD